MSITPRLSATTRRVACRQLEPELPDWEPLLALLGEELASWCTWMGSLELDDGALVHRYQHVVTRRYLHLAKDGRAFAFDWDGTPSGSGAAYEQITRAAAIRALLITWPQLGSYERGKHEPLIEAATARAVAGARFWVDPAELDRRAQAEHRLVA